MRNPLRVANDALRAAAQWRLLLISTLALLLPTTLFALPLARLLGDVFDHTLHAPQWAQQFNGLVLAEWLGVARGDSGTLLSSALLMGGLLSLILSPWLTGMTFVAARAKRPPAIDTLLQGGLQEYGPLLRLLLWGLLPLGLALVVTDALTGMANEHAEKAILESSADLASHLAMLGGGIALLLAHLSLELARAWLAVERSRRSAVRAWWRGLGLLRRRPLRVLSVYLLTLLGVLPIVALLALARLHTPALGALGLTAAFVLTQLLVATMVWGRAARLFGLQNLVRAHLDARALG